MRARRALAAFFALAASAGGAAAHTSSTAYLSLETGPSGAELSIELALRDLEPALGLDADGDGAITWGELSARQPELEAFVAGGVALRAGEAACALAPGALLVDRRDDGAYAVLRAQAVCPGGGAPDALEYGLLFEMDPTHRAVLRWGAEGGAAALSPERRRFDAAGGTSVLGAARGFFETGLHHIAVGLDHVLFLLIVLLPIAATAPEARRAALGELLRIVTAFTLAHGASVTLAAVGAVTLPGRLVESAIALTIVLTAADNLRPFLPGPRWATAFGFGLIHGLGFAGALGPLGLPGAELAVALIGFNLGIEAGQLLIAAGFLACAWPAVSASERARALLPVGSVAASGIGLFWLAERAFGLGG